MLPPTTPSERPARLADRLEATRRGRFVGRIAEIDLFRGALLAAEPPFSVLHVHGPGGVGKTTLLREYARIAAESRRPVIHLDGRNMEPSPPGFLYALGEAMGRAGPIASPAALDWPPDAVLLVDTYETLAPLDAWLRETFLPDLPARSLVTFAGRNPPAQAWRTDVGWGDLTRVVELGNLRPAESQTYLATRGIPDDQHDGALAFTRGHPLALALIADVLTQGDSRPRGLPEHAPDVVRALLDRFVRHVPSPRHRRALEACAHTRVTTEEILAAALDGGDDTYEIFAWLRGLSFIEQGPEGLFPHDLVREVLEADLRWRNPEGYRELHQRVRRPTVRRLQQAEGRERQRAAFDILYLHRSNPIMARAHDWEAFGTAYAEPARPEDIPAMLALVRRYEGEASARIAAYWAERQPRAFTAFRGVGGDLVGFTVFLALQEATPEDLAADPATQAAWTFAQRHGPVQPGEVLRHVRFWSGRDTYQAVSSAQNLMAATCLLDWVTTPGLAWNFLTVAEPDFWHPIFTHIRMQRSPEAEFVVDGRPYAVYTHDWRAEPPPVWLELMGAREIDSDPQPSPLDVAPAASTGTLSRDEVAAAVRQALRDYARPERLAANPLLSSRLVDSAAGPVPAITALRSLLREAVAELAANPKDARLHRALWHTYLEPAPTQEQAAELLGLPFNTYRYHLAKGIERVTDWLWWRIVGNGSQFVG